MSGTDESPGGRLLSKAILPLVTACAGAGATSTTPAGSTADIAAATLATRPLAPRIAANAETPNPDASAPTQRLSPLFEEKLQGSRGGAPARTSFTPAVVIGRPP